MRAAGFSQNERSTQQQHSDTQEGEHEFCHYTTVT
jgi:hypothetical protein